MMAWIDPPSVRLARRRARWMRLALTLALGAGLAALATGWHLLWRGTT